MESVTLCGQFSQGVPENPGQTLVAKFVANPCLHLIRCPLQVLALSHSHPHEGFLHWGGGAVRDNNANVLTIPSAFLKPEEKGRLACEK